MRIPWTTEQGREKTHYKIVLEEALTVYISRTYFDRKSFELGKSFIAGVDLGGRRPVLAIRLSPLGKADYCEPLAMQPSWDLWDLCEVKDLLSERNIERV